jgi:hypothetical protein
MTITEERPFQEIGAIVVDPGGRWRFEISNLSALRAAIGDDVLTAFCACFLGADRLTALTDFASMSSERHGEQSTAHLRNLDTMFWLVTGTLRELALAVRHLRSSLAKAGLLGDYLGEAWKRILEIEQWEADPICRDVRNKIGFHFDRRAIKRGIADFCSRGGLVVLAEGDSRRVYQTHLKLGHDALVQGLGISEAELIALVSLGARHQRVPDAFHEVFRLVTERRGLGPERPVRHPMRDE